MERIRAARSEDAARLAALRALWAAEQAGAGHDREAVVTAGFLASTTAWLDGARDVLVAEDERLVGMVSSTFFTGMPWPGGATSRWVYLAHLYVLPGCRGRGIGRALIDECAERARDRGATRLVLRSPPSAAGWHRAGGFESSSLLEKALDDR